MTDEQMVEDVARALAQEDGLTICSDATYALSSYGPKAKAAIAAVQPYLAKAREEVEAIREAE